MCVCVQVLVELGNDVGFQNILEARDMILDVSIELSVYILIALGNDELMRHLEQCVLCVLCRPQTG